MQLCSLVSDKEKGGLFWEQKTQMTVRSDFWGQWSNSCVNACFNLNSYHYKRGLYCLWWWCLCLCSARPALGRLLVQRPRPVLCGWCRSTPGGRWRPVPRSGWPDSRAGWRTLWCGLDSRTCTTTVPPALERTLSGTGTEGPRTGKA